MSVAADWPVQLKDIAEKFKWDECVVKFVLDEASGLGSKSLQDFLRFVLKEREITDIVKAIPTCSSKRAGSNRPG